MVPDVLDFNEKVKDTSSSINQFLLREKVEGLKTVST